MSERKVRKDVILRTTISFDSIAVYSLGTIVYPDEEIDFDKVILECDYSFVGGGFYTYDDKYIYRFITRNTLGSIFDIDNRCEINNKYEIIKMSDKIKEKKLRRKLF